MFPGEKRTLSAHHLLSIRFHYYPRNTKPTDLPGVGYVMFPEAGGGIIDDVHMERHMDEGMTNRLEHLCTVHGDSAEATLRRSKVYASDPASVYC